MLNVKTFCIIFAILVFQTESLAQFRNISSNSVEEDMLLSTNLNLINTNKFYPQSADFINQLSSTDRILFSNKQFDYFQWNNPEYFGNKRVKFTQLNFIKKQSENGFYLNPNRFYSWESNDRKDYLVVNPVLDLSVGKDIKSNNSILYNGRGFQVLGQFGNKLVFQTTMVEYQAEFQGNFNQYKSKFNVFPGLGNAQVNSFKYWDYFNARGSLTAKLLEKIDPSNKIDSVNYQIVASFGHDKQFIGSGFRSLIISDFAPQSLFLQVNYKLGPFRYQNLFKQLISNSQDSNRIFNKKYLALHRGSLQLFKNVIEIGLTEMIVQSRKDNSFDANYLNPVIFYRSIERELGSGDNAFIALDAKYTKKQFLAYGQILIDEFEVKKVFSTVSSRNKLGYQLGFYIKPQIRFLKQNYINLEYNQVTPFTYSHWTNSFYSSYNQPMAHPLESNFREVLLRLFFVPQNLQRWTFRNITSLALKGFDINGGNYGSDIRKSYYTAVDKDKSVIGQGDKSRIFNILNEVTFYAMPNLLLQFTQQFRSQSNINQSNNYLYFSIKYNFTDTRSQTIF